MTVKEFMERVGTTKTGRAIAYIKDGMEELNMLSETHIAEAKINIDKDKRYYTFPADYIKITDIRVKNHLNSKDEYRSIPRMIGEPAIEDGDNV
tara:strand:+ start:283 stop:564 length:282 start_codon:yes stop_codon:yes gene_type:complete